MFELHLTAIIDLPGKIGVLKGREIYISLVILSDDDVKNQNSVSLSS